MRPTRTVSLSSAVVLALSLVAASLVFLAPQSRAATSTLYDLDFEAGSYAPWIASGGPALAVIDDGTGANKVLDVTNRVNAYDTISSPVGDFVEGTPYTFSFDIKASVATDLRLVVNEPGAANEYVWVGNTSASAGAWTTVTGTFTLGAGAASAKVYIDVTDLTDFQVDNVLVTSEVVPPAPTAVTAVDFNDGTSGTWTQSGGDGSTLTYVADPEDGANTVLSVARTDNYVGIQSPASIFVADETYTFSMRVRLANPADGNTSVRFVMKPAYDWIANTGGVSGSGWTTVTGSFTVPAGGDTTQLQAYIGTDDASVAGAAYTYLVDDILVTAASSGGGVTPDPDFVPGGAIAPTTTPVFAAQGSGNVAALTFDDGPNTSNTPVLLDYLKSKNIHAVFCVIGQNITAPGGADLLKRIVAEGHTLCNHSDTYDDMGSLTPAQVETKMKANLAIIRTALGDPNAKVPFFRAPNGSWGVTAPVAVALGMQPLAVRNLISDWETQDIPTLTTRLRDTMVAGELVNLHDGGGDRSGTIAAVQTVVDERLAAGWTFTLPVGAPPAAETIAISTDFEDGLDGWAPRDNGTGAPTVAITTADAHGGAQAALVSGRTSQGSGIGFDVTSALTPGVTYEMSAWVKFAAGPVDDVWMTLQNDTGTDTTYSTLAQFTGMSSSDWVQVTAQFTMPASVGAVLYFETDYNGTNVSDFMMDDIVVKVPAPAVVQDLTPLKDSVPFPIGVAIDSRETSGSGASLLLKHFDQITPENYMKPEAWYDADGKWAPNASEIDPLMDFASENGLRLYGHVLVWHSQTPDFFFQHDDGTPLTSSEADKQILRDRMRTHIDNVAKYLSDGWGEFGSATNPLVAFDVVNETVDDGSGYADGMRRSQWYSILGEEYIDDAFAYANEAFNGTYADAAADHPVTLFINDYNTEQDGKRGRYLALIQRMLDRGVPVDGIGHQFHVSLSVPVTSLAAALDDAEALGLKQAVTEFDVTTGTPESQAKFIDQGYYYRDAFNIFRDHADDMFSVTVWGLIDSRSWRDSSGGPLVFEDGYQAKPAYYGVVEGLGTENPLPSRQRTADVFAGTTSIDASGVVDPEWSRLPLHSVDAVADFQLRWATDHLTAYVSVDDATSELGDTVEFQVGGTTYRLARDGSGDVNASVTERAGGYELVAAIPLNPAVAEADTLGFDIRVKNPSGAGVAWNSPGVLGTLTLVESASYTEIPEAVSAPAIDGTRDAAWDDATVVTTDKEVNGTGGAVGTFHLLWRGNVLYILADVADPTVDVSGSDPWVQDSVEIYVDPGNAKNGSYRYDDTQIRINADNAVSFGAGDEAFQAARVTSATTRTATGYTVEAAISLLDSAGIGTYQGVDFQVNDAANGARSAIRNWADPTGTGYQSTSRWGVAQLVQGQVASPLADELLVASNRGEVSVPAYAKPGDTIRVNLGSGYEGVNVAVYIYSDPVLMGGGVVSATGGTTATIPPSAVLGSHKVAVYDARGALIGWAPITLAVNAGGSGGLAFTGAESTPLAYVAAFLILLGAFLANRPPRKRSS